MNNGKIAKSFNLIYQSIVNDKKPQIKDDVEFDVARDYISRTWQKLDLAVMEFLAIYMIRHPEGKIEFSSSNEHLLDLCCKDSSNIRLLSFNDEGVIVRDEQMELAQKGE